MTFGFEEAPENETRQEKEERLRARAEQSKYQPSIFMIYEARDEVEPHSFIMRDSLYQ